MNRKVLLGLAAGISLLLTACSSTCKVDGSTATPGTAEDFEANVPNTVYFDFDKSSVSDTAKKRLEAQASWLKTYSATKATVEGHCDVRGTAEYNMALGEARANSVSKVLHTQGVDKERVSVVSYGKERPVDSGVTEMSHAKNRRAVTVINK